MKKRTSGILTLLSLLLFFHQALMAQEESVRWLSFQENGIDGNVRGLNTLENSGNLWKGRVTNPFSHEQSIDLLEEFHNG